MPTPIISLPQSNLAPNATFNSVPAPGPLALPGNCTSLTIALSMAAADQTDTANAITWDVYVAPPGTAPAAPPPSAGWTNVSHDQWHGGTFVDHQGVTHPANLGFTESIQPEFAGGWVAAAGKNTGAAVKVGCTVTADP